MADKQITIAGNLTYLVPEALDTNVLADRLTIAAMHQHPRVGDRLSQLLGWRRDIIEAKTLAANTDNGTATLAQLDVWIAELISYFP